MIIRSDITDYSFDDVEGLIKAWDDTPLLRYERYYKGYNVKAIQQYQHKATLGDKPNHLITSPYFSTLVDGAAAYSFSAINYTDKPGDGQNADVIQAIHNITNQNASDVVDSKVGVYQLGYGFAAVLHWVNKGQENGYRYDVIDPLEVIPIYDLSVETNLIAVIHHRAVTSDKKVYTVYTDDRVKEWEIDGGKQKLTLDMPNDYKIVPWEIYWNNSTKGEFNSICGKVLSYIDAIDTVLTGNWNEISRFAESILTAARQFRPEDKENIEYKRLMDGMGEDWNKLQYLTKQVQWEYQQFFYKILVSELHKHTHVIDFQNPDAGIGSAASGTALRYRMLDMEAMALRYERLNREGQYRRLYLLQNIGAIPDGDLSGVEVVYNHNIPEDIGAKMQALNSITFLSDTTKQEMIGVDPVAEAEKISQEAEGKLDRLDLVSANGNVAIETQYDGADIDVE